MAAKLIPIWVVAAAAGGMTLLSAGVSYLMRQKSKLGENKPNEYATNIVDTDAFVPIAFGKCVIPNLLNFADSNPDDINELHGVATLCMGPIEEIDAIYFNNMEVIARRDGDHWEYHENYAPPALHFERRRGVAADATAKRRYDTVTKLFKKWTSKHLSAGIASFYMLLNYDQDKLNSIPLVYARVRGRKVLDVRDDTVKYSNNPVLCLLHYLLDTVHGKGLTLSTQIIKDSFIAEANYCDESIDYQKVEPPEKIDTIYLVPKEKDNPFTAGQTYYFKYAWARGAEIESEDDAYDYYISALSPVSSGVAATSDYGRFVLTSIDAPGESDDVTVKPIYMSTASGGTYYWVDVLDPEDTKHKVYGYKTAVPYAANGSVPAPSSNCSVTFEDWSTSGLDGGKYYRYKATFKTADGETAPSPATKKIKTKSNQKVIKIKLPETDDKSVTHVGLYRTEGYTDPGEHKTNSDFKKVADIAIGTNYHYDTLADGSLGAAAPSTTTTLHSTIDRFNCNGLLDTGNDQDDNIEQLLSSCRGRLYNEGGRYRIFIPKITVPETYELTPDNIIGDWEFTIKGMSDKPNVAKGTFINPKQSWKSDTVIWPKHDRNNYYLKDDNDFKKVIPLDLPFTTNKRIAKTICQVIRKVQRNNIIAEVTAMPSARILRGGNLVMVTHPTPGWTQKKFWVDGVGIFPNGTVRLILSEYTEDDYNYETLDEDTLPGTDTDLGDPQEAPDEVTGVAFTEVSYVNKKVTYWKLKVTYTDPTSAFWKRSDVYMKVGGGDYELYTTINKESNGVFYVDPIQEATNYYFKILSVSTLNAKLDLDDTEVTEWTHETEGVLGDPDAIPSGSFTAAVSGSTVTLAWPLPTVDDFWYCEIRRTTGTGAISTDAEWDAALKIAKSSETQLVLNTVSAGTYRFWIRVYDKKLNDSTITGTEAVTVTDDLAWSQIYVDDFTLGTHDGTEAVNHGTYGQILQMGQSALTNAGFESALGAEWSVGTGWSRVSGGYSGSWSIKVEYAASYGDRTTQNITTPTITAGKDYIFKAWVRSNVAGVARIAVDLDGTITYSTPHPGDGVWRILNVVRTCGTPTGTPKVILYVGTLSAGQYAQYDLCGFTRFVGQYSGSHHDNGTSEVRRYKLDHRVVHTLGAFNPPGSYIIDLGLAESSPSSDSSYTWYPGLESQEITAAGRYRKFRVRFINVWVDEVLYVRNCDDTAYVRFYDSTPEAFAGWYKYNSTTIKSLDTIENIMVGTTDPLAAFHLNQSPSTEEDILSLSEGPIAGYGGIDNLTIRMSSTNLGKDRLMLKAIDDMHSPLLSFRTTGAGRLTTPLISFMPASATTDVPFLNMRMLGGQVGPFVQFTDSNFVMPPAAAPPFEQVSGGSKGSRTYYMGFTYKTATGETTICTLSGPISMSANYLLEITFPFSPDPTITHAVVYVATSTSVKKQAEVALSTEATATWTEQTSALLTTTSPPATNTTGDVFMKIGSPYVGTSPNILIEAVSGQTTGLLQFNNSSGTEVSGVNPDGGWYCEKIAVGTPIFAASYPLDVKGTLKLEGNLLLDGSILGDTGLNVTIATASGEAGRQISFTTNSTVRMSVEDGQINIYGNEILNIGTITGKTGVNSLIRTYAENSRKISFSVYGGSAYYEKMYVDINGVTITDDVEMQGNLDMNEKAIQGTYLIQAHVDYDIGVATHPSSSGKDIHLTVAGYNKAEIREEGVVIIGDVIRIQSAKTPASASATGSQGQICWDSGNLYVCTATDTWKKVPILTW